MELHKFSEVVNTEVMEGEKCKVDEVLDRQITVTNSKVIPDKFSSKENATVTIIQLELDGEKKILYTRSAVLTKQLAMMKDKMPFTAKIVKQKKYLTFV